MQYFLHFPTIFAIFDYFSEFCDIFGTFHFEKSSNIAKNLEKIKKNLSIILLHKWLLQIVQNGLKSENERGFFELIKTINKASAELFHNFKTSLPNFWEFKSIHTHIIYWTIFPFLALYVGSRLILVNFSPSQILDWDFLSSFLLKYL